MTRHPAAGPLLILGRDAHGAISLLERAGFECRICADLAALCAEVNDDVGSVLATDEAFGRIDLHDLTQKLAAQPTWSDLPFVVLTRRGAGYRRALEDLRLPEVLGNVVFLERPLTALGLVSVVRSSMRARLRQRQIAVHLADEIAMVALRKSEAHARELEQQKRELERSNAALEQFAYAASHDLQSPLRAIAHLSQWIDEDIRATASPETMDHLTLLNGRVTRLQTLTSGLLAYARIRHSDLGTEDVDVAGLVQDIVKVLEPRPTFLVTFEGQMATIRTHRTSIELVLKNLISNALQHHDHAAGGHVHVAMRPLDGMMEFRVSDDGPGIDPRFHEQIFVIFKTLQSRDDFESVGMGLSIAKKQVTENGGQIWVESAPPARGATFIFTWKEAVQNPA